MMHWLRMAPARQGPSVGGKVGSAALLALVTLSCGCGGGDGLVPADGKVRYRDGGIPQGEIAMITFEPEALGSGGASNEKVKGAGGTIQPDGSFALTTIDPGDGAYPGKYQVTLKVLETYNNQKSLVAAPYASKTTTPLSAEVPPGGKTDFEFIVERAAGR